MIREPTFYIPDPIIDPIDTTPQLFPTAYEITKYEAAFPIKQRLWINQRDGGYSNMPILEDGKLVGFDKGLTKRLQVHHIVPQAWYKKQFGPRLATRYMHNPLNAITLDILSHNVIHREWMTQYREEYCSMPEGYKKIATLEDYVKWQVDQGRPFWCTDWDGIFFSIAVMRTYDYMGVSDEFPFHEEYKEQTIYHYTMLRNTEPDFVDRYYESIS